MSGLLLLHRQGNVGKLASPDVVYAVFAHQLDGPLLFFTLIAALRVEFYFVLLDRLVELGPVTTQSFQMAFECLLDCVGRSYKHLFVFKVNDVYVLHHNLSLIHI